MKKPNRKLRPVTRSIRQQGAALIISLLILVIMLLIGVSAIRTTTMEEKMAGNLRDRGLAFQAAETALRDGEQFIEGLVNLDGFNGTGGLYGEEQTEPANFFDNSQWNNARVYSGTLAKVASQPRYMLKVVDQKKGDTETLNISGYGKRRLAAGTVIFRVTSRGTGGSDNSQVVLRSHYGREM